MKQLQWFPGHMAKARRIIEEKLPLVDVVIELLDARIPLSSRNPMINEIIKNKPKLIILNKSDLADEKATKEWVEYLKKESYTISVSSLDMNNLDTIILKASKEILKEKLLNDQKKGLKNKAIRIMVVGIPNVGKSTFINKLAKRSALITGDKPGVTKQMQYVKISDELELLDNPGILWPKFENENVAYNLALIGSIKDQIIPIDDVAIYGIKKINKYYPQVLMERYGAKYSEDILETYDAIGRRMGLLLPKNQIDYDKVSIVFLYDLRHKKLGRLTFERVDENV